MNLKKILSVSSVVFCLLLTNFAQAESGVSCISLFQGSNYKALGVHRLESLVGRTVRVVDISQHIAERRAKSEPDLKIFDIGQVLEGEVFLGFGKPNVYLGIPKLEEGGYNKFAAKSLKRGDSQLVDTKGRVQSGILLVFKDLKQENIERIYEASKQHVGTRRWTCVNANCRVLKDAGFTIGGESLAQYNFPMPFLRDVLKYGLELDGKPVEFDVVRTTPNYLEDVGLSINKAVWATPYRHGLRAFTPLLVKIKTAKSKFLGLFMHKEVEEQTAKEEVIDVTPIEKKPIKYAGPKENLREYDLAVSEPTSLGTLLRLAWGPHALFEISHSKENIQSYLPETLKSFPQENPSMVTKIKKHFLFSKPVVTLIREQLAGNYSVFSSMNEQRLYDMLRTDSAETPNRYNIVVTGDKIIIMKIAIRMKYVDWILSKHVLISGYSKDVRFAGEIWKGEDGKLYMSNNSGTYQPSKDQLLKTVDYFKTQFPNLPFEAAPL